MTSIIIEGRDTSYSWMTVAVELDHLAEQLVENLSGEQLGELFDLLEAKLRAEQDDVAE